MTGIERENIERRIAKLYEQRRRVERAMMPGIGRSLARIYQQIIDLKRQLERA